MTIGGELPVLSQYANVVVVPRARDYVVDGVRFQRVTTALSVINKPALIPWAKKVALAKVADVLLYPEVREELVLAIEETPAHYEAFVQRVVALAAKAPDTMRDERAESGTEAHRLIQEIPHFDEIVGREAYLSMLPVEYVPAVSAAFDFVSDFGITVYDTERIVWSPIHKVAGTIDGVGCRDGRLVIWDWKTGAHIYWETALQLGAYAHLLQELTGTEVAEAYAVRLPRAGEPPEYEAKRLDKARLAAAWSAYSHSFALYQASKRDLWKENGA